MLLARNYCLISHQIYLKFCGDLLLRMRALGGRERTSSADRRLVRRFHAGNDGFHTRIYGFHTEMMDFHTKSELTAVVSGACSARRSAKPARPASPHTIATSCHPWPFPEGLRVVVATRARIPAAAEAAAWADVKHAEASAIAAIGSTPDADADAAGRAGAPLESPTRLPADI